MNESDKRAIWNAIFGAVGLSATGFFLGLRKVVWALWAVISVLWIIFWLVVSGSKIIDAIMLLITFGAPVLLFFLLLLLQSVMEALGRIAGVESTTGSSANQAQKTIGKNAIDSGDRATSSNP